MRSVRAAAASSIGGLAAQAKEGDADAAAALDGLPLRQLLASRLGDADRSVRRGRQSIGRRGRRQLGDHRKGRCE